MSTTKNTKGSKKPSTLATKPAIKKNNHIAQIIENKRAKALNKSIKDWLKQTIVDVVLTPGGGLKTVIMDDSLNPQSNKQSFEEYLEEAVIKILNHFAPYSLNRLESDDTDDANALIWEVFPMFWSDKDDGGVTYEKYCDLKQIIIEFLRCNQ
jgi:hypothetical protein